ncbi:MAG: DUF6273 domain-containing protein [bacterium]|nr:DUF6273 domain-containing protein [bacterium]
MANGFSGDFASSGILPGGADGEYGKGNSKTFVIVCVVLAVIGLAAAAFATIFFFAPNETQKKYDFAEEQMKAGYCRDAVLLFEELHNFKDADYKASKAKLLALNEMLKNSQFEDVVNYSSQLRDKDWNITSGDVDLQNQVKFGLAGYYYQQEDYLAALEICRQLEGVPGCQEMVKACEENLGGKEYFAFKDREKRSVMTFGRFEQDNNASNGPEPIEWYVAANVDNKDGIYLLLYSKYCLDCRPYQNKKPFTDWKNCSLRKWLNNDFYNKAFSKQEREKIQTVEIRPDWNKFFNDNIAEVGKDSFFKTLSPREMKGPVSLDKVFIFASPELRYLDLDKGSYKTGKSIYKEVPTPYAVSRGAYLRGDTCWDWSRENYGGFGHELSPEDFIVSKPAVGGYGNFYADSAMVTVRPAILVAAKKKHLSGSGAGKASSSVPAGS